MSDRFRTPLARVRGLGSARGGTHHFIAQRLTAIALVPLLVWLVASLVSVAGADHAHAVAWLRSPVATVLALGLVIAAFHHAQLGLQVVAEDYLHDHGQKILALVLIKLLAIVLGATAALAVLRVALGG